MRFFLLGRPVVKAPMRRDIHQRPTAGAVGVFEADLIFADGLE